MASLRIGGGSSKHFEDNGSVVVDGGCAMLFDANDNLVLAYKLKDGETVRRVGEDEYVVEF